MGVHVLAVWKGVFAVLCFQGKHLALKAISFAYFSWQDKKSEAVRQDRKTQVYSTVAAPNCEDSQSKAKSSELAANNVRENHS